VEIHVEFLQLPWGIPRVCNLDMKEEDSIVHAKE